MKINIGALLDIQKLLEHIFITAPFETVYVKMGLSCSTILDISN